MPLATRIEWKRKPYSSGEVEVEITTCDLCDRDLEAPHGTSIADSLLSGGGRRANANLRLSTNFLEWNHKRGVFGEDDVCSTCYDILHQEGEDLRGIFEAGKIIRARMRFKRQCRNNCL